MFILKINIETKNIKGEDHNMVKNLKNKKRKKGFTLIELIIVIAIIAILAAIAVPKFGEIRQSASEKSDVANAKTIANGVASLIADNDITIPSKTDLIIDNNRSANYATSKTDEDKIEEYLQTVPTIKSVSGATNFIVSISDKGDITVKSGSATGSKVFFPQ